MCLYYWLAFVTNLAYQLETVMIFNACQGHWNCCEQTYDHLHIIIKNSWKDFNMIFWEKSVFNVCGEYGNVSMISECREQLQSLEASIMHIILYVILTIQPQVWPPLETGQVQQNRYNGLSCSVKHLALIAAKTTVRAFAAAGWLD